MKKFLFLTILIWNTNAFTADLKSLGQLFYQNYNFFYTPRMCGKNIARLINEAVNRKIDLSNAYVLRLAGNGFLETSGFYTRVLPNDREMLGYFHIILIADGFVFDFDLSEPMVLRFDEYIRLQFTPPYTPYIIFGINYDPLKELSGWKVTSYEVSQFLTSNPQKLWEKKMEEIIDLKHVTTLKRLR